jgi:large subunit ribosomal protein L9
MAKQTLLLLEDVEGLGRSGDIVNAAAGFARNFILPRRKGVIATKNAIRMQERLQEERTQKAIVDKADSERVAESLKGKSYETIVKTDPDGHMYGSVSHHDIVEMLKANDGVELTKKDVMLAHAIKATGVYTIPLKLREGIMAEIVLKVTPETVIIQTPPEAEGAPKKEGSHKREERSRGMQTR